MGVVKISMIKYPQKVLDEFMEYLTGISDTPTADHLFQVRGEEEATVLEKYRVEMFHHSMAHL